MNVYSPELDRFSNLRSFDYYFSNRRWIAMMRLYMYNWLFHTHFGFRNHSWWRPGLEMKFACESAERVGAKLMFAGPEFD